MTVSELKSELAALGRPVPRWGGIRAVQESLAAARAWDEANPDASARFRALCAQLDDAERREDELREQERRDRKLALALATAGLGERALAGVDVATETQALEAARDWLQGGKRIGTLVLCGPTGSGKTVAATWALKAAATAGESVAFRGTAQLARQSAFDDGAREIDWLKRVGVLAVDDLGAENATGHAQGILSEILDARHQRYGRTVLTTNIAAVDLAARVGARLVDRWREDGRIVQLTGGSLRKRGGVAS